MRTMQYPLEFSEYGRYYARSTKRYMKVCRITPIRYVSKEYSKMYGRNF